MNRKFRRSMSALGIALAAGLASSACGYVSAQPGVQGVVVNDYWIIPSAKEVTGCISPETTQNEITNTVYWYPSRQISWDATGQQGSERGPYKVVSSAAAPGEMNVPVVVTMDLTRDCELLKEFHRDFGTKYQGWLKDDGTTSQGWLDLLNYAVGQPME